MASGSDVVVAGSAMKTCKRCKSIAQSGLKCIKCGVVSHNSCVSRLKNITVIDDKSIICCDFAETERSDVIDNDFDVSFSSAKDVMQQKTGELYFMEVSHLKEIIVQKDIIIENQKDVISSLKEQICLLNKILNKEVIKSDSICVVPSDKQILKPNKNNWSRATRQPGPAPKEETLACTVSNAHQNLSMPTVKSQNLTKPTNNSCSSNEKVNKISTDDVSNALKLNLTKIKCQEIIHLNEDPFTEVKHKKKRKSNKTIVGNMDLGENPKVKAASKLAFLHVFKLHPDTTAEELTSIINPTFPEAFCEKIKSMYPRFYSSFKVTINEANLNNAWNPEVWPKGAWVNQFFHSRKPITPEK